MENQKLDKIAEDMTIFIPLFRKAFLRIHRPGSNKINSQYHILWILFSRGRLSMSSVGEILGISKPNMTALIDNLIDEKKVKRIYDSKDRRVIKIEITEKGRNFLKGGKEIIRQELKKRFSDLNERDTSILLVSLQNIKKIISKINSKENKNEK